MMMGWGRSQAEELHLATHLGWQRVAWGWWQFPNRQLQSFQRAAVNVCNGAQLSIYPSVGSKCLSLQISLQRKFWEWNSDKYNQKVSKSRRREKVECTFDWSGFVRFVRFDWSDSPTAMNASSKWVGGASTFLGHVCNVNQFWAEHAKKLSILLI